MVSDDKSAGNLPNTTRTEALSDGVFAIAMTLLVLDVRVPPHEGGLLRMELLRQWPVYVAFLASFLYIAVIWANHHAAFRQITTVDRALGWANTAILLGAVVLPFPTAVLADSFRAGDPHDERTAVVLYAALAVFMSATWLAFFWLLDRRIPADSCPGATPWKVQARRPITGIIGYFVGAGLAVAVQPAIGLAVLAIPGYYAITSEGLRRSPRARTGQPRVGRRD
jgi:uncharacterized membrane protein